MKGRWHWHELMTPDTHKARVFYERMFGWGTAEMPMPSGMYYVWQHGGSGHGGMMQTGGPGLEHEAPRWLIYLTTDDVDRDFIRIAVLGGKALTHVQDVPGVGRWFLAQDPTGAEFAVMQPAQGAMPQAVEPMPPAHKPPSRLKAPAKPTAKPKGKAAGKTKPTAKAKSAKPAKAAGKLKPKPKKKR